MNAKDRKKLLIDLDLTIVELARRIGRDKSWVTQTIHERKHPRPTQELIAKELNVPVDILFPSHRRAA